MVALKSLQLCKENTWVNSITKIISNCYYLGWIYVIDWNKDRPSECYPIAKVPTLQMNFADDDLLLITFKDGSW